MTDKKKKIILAAGITAIVIAGGFLAFKYGLRMSPSTTAPEAQNASGNKSTEDPNANLPKEVVLFGQPNPQNGALVAVTSISAADIKKGLGYGTFTLTGKDHYFAPDTIKVKKGDRVSVKIIAADDMYDFHVPDFMVAVPIFKGEGALVEFPATKAGRFPFFCEGCKRIYGVDKQGTLIVEEN